MMGRASHTGPGLSSSATGFMPFRCALSGPDDSCAMRDEDAPFADTNFAARDTPAPVEGARGAHCLPTSAWRERLSRNRPWPVSWTCRSTMTSMPDTIVEDRRATREELVTHRDALLKLAAARRLSNLRLRNDAAIVLTTASPGYRDVASFVNVASELVGAYVYVVTDDTPGLGAVVAPL